jgi:ATP synthase protein I
MVRAAFTGDRNLLHSLDVASVETMGTRNQGDDGDRSAEEAALSARLRRLGERLDEKKASEPTDAGPTSNTETSAMAGGLRLSAELVGGVIGGALIGWLLDHFLGIAPFGLITFVLLGFAAGILSLMRAAGFLPSGAGRPDNQK